MMHDLAELVKTKIQEDFTRHHYTGSTANSVSISYDDLNHTARITVNPPRYDWFEFYKHGMVVPTSTTSYAGTVNRVGSKIVLYPTGKRGSHTNVYVGNHKNFAYKCALEAAELFQQMYGGMEVR